MSDYSPLNWIAVVLALVLGILAGHFGWGRGWPARRSKLHPDYLAGLDFLVTEQPDRALDMFLKLMEANPDTVETHFSLGSLYRRRGEVERAIRIHQNLLERGTLAAPHREQALLALAQDYLRAGLLDRAEQLFQQVSEVPRLRAVALDALRSVYERQHEWSLALKAHRSLARINAAAPPLVAAHYLCELAASAIERGDTTVARELLREARAEHSPFPRAAVLRAQIAERAGDHRLAIGLLRAALQAAPKLLHEELPHLLRLVPPAQGDRELAELVAHAEAQQPEALKPLVFAALAAGRADAASIRAAVERVFAQDPALQPLRGLACATGALLAHAEKYRCGECGFAGRNFYWHCPACHTWDSFEPCASVKLG